MDLQNKIIVITGATGGIGREIVKNLDEEGARLVLVSKSEEELKNLTNSLKNKESQYVSCNLADQKAAIKLGAFLSDKFKQIDVLIHAAGIGVYKPIEDLTFDDWNDSININLNSPFILTKSVAGSLKTAKESVVVSLGSGNGELPIPGRSAYCASKFGLRGWSLSMSEEFKGTNVDFCLMTLGSILTSFGPMSFEDKKREMESGKGYLTPEFVAKKVVEIIKSDNREVEYKYYPSGYEAQN